MDIYEMAHSNNDAARLLSELNTLHRREVGFDVWQSLAARLSG